MGKEFDRSMCCTFFGTWVDYANTLEHFFCKEVKADFYDAILNYSLYGQEP